MNSNDKYLKIFHVYAPFVKADLWGIMKEYEVDASAEVSLLKHYAGGLAWLHHKGLVHRDISPRNLTVTTLNPPTGIILDLDEATSNKTETDGDRGTRLYRAPDLVDIATTLKAFAKPYDRMVDVWALGLVLFVMHRNWCRFHWDRFRSPQNSAVPWGVDSGRYDDLREEISIDQLVAEETDEIVFITVIEKLLQWSSTSRISAADAVKESQATSTGEAGSLVVRPTKRAAKEDEEEDEEVQGGPRKAAKIASGGHP